MKIINHSLFTLTLFSFSISMSIGFSGASLAETTTRASVSTDGAQADGYNSSAIISGNGSAVVFVSNATTLVADDTNNATDIFVRDMRQNITTRVSVNSAGEQANGLSLNPAISHDGRYVVFESNASNLVADDTNNTTDVFLHDRVTGTTERISYTSEFGQTNYDSHSPAISADGRYIAYFSYANNLVAADTNNSDDIFVYDRRQGTTERISVNDSGVQANSSSYFPQLSADGRYVSFYSIADNLVPDDTNGMFDVFLYDRVNQTMERVSVGSGGEQADNHSFSSSISADGRYVAFESSAGNLVTGDTNRRTDIFLRDRVTQTTSRISLLSDGSQPMGASRSPKISTDGSYVVFSSLVDLLIGSDTNGREDIYSYHLGDGALELLSVDSDGNLGDYNSSMPSINADGRFIAFQSTAANLVADDTNIQDDIFVRARGPLNLPPVAKAGQDVNVYLGQTVALDGSASFDPDGDAIVSYLWNLELAPAGSGATLTAVTNVNSSFTPDKAGEYVVSLVVNDGMDNSLADEIFIHVIENLPPAAVISPSAVSGEAPLTVQFSGSDSSDPENSALSYHWDFGVSGTASDLAETEYTFTVPGVYTVVLTVRDDLGNIGEAAVDIEVTANNQPPSVNPYTSTPAQGPAPLSVSFMANAGDLNGDILSYFWDFGDGVNSSEENPSHTFTEPGSYTVSVEVSDGEFTTRGLLYVSVESTLSIQVSEAEMGWERHGGKLKLGIQFNYGAVLLSSDVIRVNFATLMLLDAPLAAFERQEPGVYVYKDRHVYAKLDLNNGNLTISKRLKSSKAIEAGQPAPVKVSFGQATGLDQITLSEEEDDTDHRSDSRHEHHKHASFCKQKSHRR